MPVEAGRARRAALADRTAAERTASHRTTAPGAPELECEPVLANADPPALSGDRPGSTFVDVGCMWNVHGDYAFHALAHGAVSVAGVDVEPATREFVERNAALGNRVRFVQADLNEPALVDRVGRFDVVFCSGVLYHVPNPLLTLQRLRQLCEKTLILTSASVGEGRIPQAAISLPCLPAEVRDRLRFRRGSTQVLTTDFELARGYGNWFWLPTPTCLSAMATAAGFAVRECLKHRHVTTLVAEPVAEVAAAAPSSSVSAQAG
jgi:SAM-dependent methyltransferase